LLMVHLKKGGFKEFAVAPVTPAKAEGEVAA
jgi:tRNA uridine 5-carboxymethylaminomethyl modification enzyme